MTPLEYVINMRPGVGVPPTVNVSQGDIDREIAFSVMDGLNPYDFTGNETCVITGTKPSGLGFTVNGTISGSIVTFYTSEDMTQESGAIRTELVLTDGVQYYRIGSANFNLVVEPTTHDSSVIDGSTEEARTVLEECEQYANDAASSAQQAAQSAAGAATAGATAGAAAGEEAAQEVVGVIEDELTGLREDLNLLEDATVEKTVEPETSDVDLTIHDGFLGKNGNIYHNDNYDKYGYTDIIPVEAGDIITIYNGTSQIHNFYVVCQYANEVFISGSENVTVPFTVPDGTDGIAVTMNQNQKSAYRMTLTRDVEVFTPILEDRVAALETSVEGKANQNDVDELVDEITGKIDKDGIEQVTAKNCEFIQIAPNLFDKTAVEIGIVNKGTGALLPNYTNYRTSDWIEVKGSTDYTFSSSGGLGLYWCWYDTSKTYISGGEGGIMAEPTKQSPQNAGYIRFSLANNSLNSDIQLEEGDSATSYREYGSGYIKKEYIPPSNTEEFILNLPKKINAVVGVEMNVYFDNIVEGHDIDYDWNVDCSSGSVGMQMERGYRIVALEAGTYSLTFTATRKYDKSTVSKTTTLSVVAADSEIDETVSVIVIGDSTTDGGTVMRKLHDNFASDTMNVATLGTRGTSPYNHEGRSGWKFSLYFTRAANDGGTVLNPFYNPTTETFDANYYFTNSGVRKPDYFIINLGINDMFGSTNDTQLDSNIVQAINYCDSMIESVQSASPSTKVCVCLTIPPNYSQDAFGKEYKIGQTQHRYKRNNLLWVKRLMEEYENKESEGIYVMPINLCLDTRYNMGFETIPVNSRNTDITYQSPIGNGGVHPVTSGYWQIADVFTAFLKANA